MDVAFEYKLFCKPYDHSNVSILGLMDVAFEFIIFAHFVYFSLLFQSLFLWMLLLNQDESSDNRQGIFVSILVLMDVAFEFC